nr:ABC transporter ATP-binding protein [Corynebacterium sp. TAE3-ERU12]
MSMDASTPVISVRGLTKKFGNHTAVAGLDLDLRPGTVHGFLGPNGAGKSTTIHAILGLLRPDAGSISVLGHNPTTNPSRATRRVSYVPGDVALWPQLTGAKTLATLARLRDRHGGDDPKRRAELIERFDLDPTKKIREYSKGNRQKVMLVAALAADVDVLVLDEPTSGLDPLMEDVFTECVREAVGRGQSVLLSSHILPEVQKLADDVTIIRQGRLVESGALSELTHLRGSRITADIAGTHYDQLHPRAEVSGTLQKLLDQGATNITCTDAALDDIFMDHYSAAASADAGGQR